MDPILHRFLQGDSTPDDLVSENPNFTMRIFQALQNAATLPGVDPRLLAGRVSAVFSSPLPSWLQPHAPTTQPLLKPQDLFIAVINADYRLISQLAERFPQEIQEIKDEEGRNPLFYACLATRFDANLFTRLAELCPDWLSQPNNQNNFPVEFLSKEEDKATYVRLNIFVDLKALIRHLTEINLQSESPVLQGFLKDLTKSPVTDKKAFELYFRIAKEYVEASEEQQAITLIRALVDVWPQFPSYLFALAIYREFFLDYTSFDSKSITPIKIPAELLSMLELDKWSLYREDLPEELLILYVLHTLAPDDLRIQEIPLKLRWYLSKEALAPKIQGDECLEQLELFAYCPPFLSLLTPECLPEDAALKIATQLAERVLEGIPSLSPFIKYYHALPASTQLNLLNAFKSSYLKNNGSLEFLIQFSASQNLDTSERAFFETFKTLFESIDPNSLKGQTADLQRLLNALVTCTPKMGIEPIRWILANPSFKEAFSQQEIADALYPPGCFAKKNLEAIDIDTVLRFIRVGAPLSLQNYIDLTRFSLGDQLLDTLTQAWALTSSDECRLEIDSDHYPLSQILENLIDCAHFSAEHNTDHHRKLVHLIIKLLKLLPLTDQIDLYIDDVSAIAFNCGLHEEGAQFLKLANFPIEVNSDLYNPESQPVLQEAFKEEIAQALEELKTTHPNSGIRFSQDERGSFVIHYPEKPDIRLYGPLLALKDRAYEMICELWASTLMTSMTEVMVDAETTIEAALFLERNEPLLIKRDLEKPLFWFYYLNSETGLVKRKELYLQDIPTWQNLVIKYLEFKDALQIQVSSDPKPNQTTMMPWSFDEYQLRQLPWGGVKLFYKDPELAIGYYRVFYGKNAALEYKKELDKRLEIILSVRAFCEKIPGLNFVPLSGSLDDRVQTALTSPDIRQNSVILLENKPMLLSERGPFGPIGFFIDPSLGKEELAPLLELSSIALGTVVSEGGRSHLPSTAPLVLPDAPVDTDLAILLTTKELSESHTSTLTYIIKAIRGEDLIQGWDPVEHADLYLKFRIVATHLIKELSKPENSHALSCFIDLAAGEGILCGHGLWELVWKNYQILFTGNLLQDTKGSLDAVLAQAFDQAVENFKNRLLYLSRHPYVSSQSTHISAYLNLFLHKKQSLVSLDEADRIDDYATIYGGEVFSQTTLDFMWKALMPLLLVDSFGESLKSSYETQGSVQNALKFHTEEELKSETDSPWVTNDQQVKYQLIKFRSEAGTRLSHSAENASPNRGKRSAGEAELDERIPKDNKQQEVDLFIEQIYDEQELMAPIDSNAECSVYIPTAKALLFLLERKGVLTRA
ncbi:MAG: hypothetical protein KDK62_03710 [Chlamydiia bacterium]|nr:hypothetical protein [Chlamydiia bacterium]